MYKNNSLSALTLEDQLLIQRLHLKDTECLSIFIFYKGCLYVFNENKHKYVHWLNMNNCRGIEIKLSQHERQIADSEKFVLLQYHPIYIIATPTSLSKQQKNEIDFGYGKGNLYIPITHKTF